MSLFISPPARAHLRSRDVIRSLAPFDWIETWKNFFGAEFVFGFNSARAAFFQLLVHLKEKFPSRNEVILAAYTCPSMITIVKACGLNARLCDMEPHSVSMSVENCRQLANQRTLSIVSGNLFGAADSAIELANIAESVGSVFIEDLSLAVGNELNGHRLGKFGHASIVSFGRGKVISTDGGGLLVIRDKSKIGDRFNTPEIQWASAIPFMVNLLYPLLLSRPIFGLISHTPLRPRDYSPTHLADPKTLWTHLQARLSAISLKTLETSIRRRHENSKYLLSNIQNNDDLAHLKFSQNDTPAYLRFPLLASSAELRKNWMIQLYINGFSATLGFSDIRKFLAPDLQPNAFSLTEKLFTIPCHPRMDSELNARLTTGFDAG